jgi:hypothetical protein
MGHLTEQPGGTPGEDTPTGIGVYRTASPGLAAIQAYESFLGLPEGATVNHVLAFMTDMSDKSATWAAFEGAMLQASTNAAAGTHSAIEWAPLLGGRNLILAVPACCGGTTWADEAAGANDMHWAKLANTLVAGGLGGCTLRIAREFSGGWYPWSVTPATAAAHKTGWARIVTTMKAAGFTGRFMWNPYLGQGTFAPGGYPSDAYPGSAYVNVIGLDFYDWGYPAQPDTEARTTAQQQAAWNVIRDQLAGLTGWQSFATRADISRPLAYPEWGLQIWGSGATYAGGGDNPVLISEMAAWIKFTRPWMHALWEDAGVGVSDPDDDPDRIIAVPKARAAFLDAFGYG